MRVVIAHDFAETFAGAERITREIGRAFPDAELWTILGRRKVVDRMGFGARHEFLLKERPWLLRHYRLLTPVYPALVRSRRLPEADLLISSSYAFAHGLRTRNRAPHLCYCISPLRFAWSMTDDYAERLPGGLFGRLSLRALVGAVRAADRSSVRDVTRWLAESRYVAEQLLEIHGIDAPVLWPAVDTEAFTPGSQAGHDGYFLFCGRLIEPYKRPSLVVEAFRDLPHRLIVAGDGPELERLRGIAPPNVEFRGHLSTAELAPLMRRCAAAIFPSRDDFGLVPVEVMACGRPVLAYRAGGALETVVPGLSGEFFDEQSVATVAAAVRAFDSDSYEPASIRAHAEQWDSARFRAEIVRVATEVAATS